MRHLARSDEVTLQLRADAGIVTIDGPEPRGPEHSEPLIPEATEVPRARVIAPGLWAFTVLLAIIGAIAVPLALGGALVIGVVRAGDPGLNQAVSRFTTAARGLPGVRTADAKPGLGDLGTTPTDIYGDVHLTSACTSTSLATSTTRLRAIMAREKRFLLHPTLWCGSRGLTVSPSAAVTQQRLRLVTELEADHSLHAAAVIVTQRGDDASPDLDNTVLQLDLWVSGRTSGAAASQWLTRVRRAFPQVTVSARSGSPGQYLDVLAPEKGQWTVTVQAGDPDNAAILRTAIRMEHAPTVLGASFDGPTRQAAVITSSWDALRDLRQTLPKQRGDAQPLHLAVTLVATPTN